MHHDFQIYNFLTIKKGNASFLRISQN